MEGLSWGLAVGRRARCSRTDSDTNLWRRCGPEGAVSCSPGPCVCVLKEGSPGNPGRKGMDLEDKSYLNQGQATILWLLQAAQPACVSVHCSCAQGLERTAFLNSRTAPVVRVWNVKSLIFPVGQGMSLDIELGCCPWANPQPLLLYQLILSSWWDALRIK